MGWLKWLGDLSPVALLVIVVWIIATKIIIPMLRNHEKAAETMAKAHEKHAEAVAKSLDANTEAVEKSVEHSEKIISNHLSKQAERDAVMLVEMKGVATALEKMNNRRRSTDVDSHSRS